MITCAQGVNYVLEEEGKRDNALGLEVYKFLSPDEILGLRVARLHSYALEYAINLS
jgi:hypothetical protein